MVDIYPHIPPQKRLTDVYRRQKGLINQTGESPWTGCLVLLSEFSTNDLFHPLATSRRVIISDKFMSDGIHKSPTLYNYLQ